MRHLPTAVTGLASLTLACLSAGAASAHIGIGPTSGLAAGLAHPILGLDHLATMLAVGIWAGQLGGRARLALPLSFLALFAAGMALAAIVPTLAVPELAVLASLLALGLLVAFEVRLSLIVAAVLVGLFALFHGHLHGTETPATASGLAYGTGALLTSSGVLAGGLALQRLLGRLPARLAGGLALVTGAALALAT